MLLTFIQEGNNIYNIYETGVIDNITPVSLIIMIGIIVYSNKVVI